MGWHDVTPVFLYEVWQHDQSWAWRLTRSTSGFGCLAPGIDLWSSPQHHLKHRNDGVIFQMISGVFFGYFVGIKNGDSCCVIDWEIFQTPGSYSTHSLKNGGCCKNLKPAAQPADNICPFQDSNCQRVFNSCWYVRHFHHMPIQILWELPYVMAKSLIFIYTLYETWGFVSPWFCFL